MLSRPSRALHSIPERANISLPFPKHSLPGTQQSVLMMINPSQPSSIPTTHLSKYITQALIHGTCVPSAQHLLQSRHRVQSRQPAEPGVCSPSFHLTMVMITTRPPQPISYVGHTSQTDTPVGILWLGAVLTSSHGSIPRDLRAWSLRIFVSAWTAAEQTFWTSRVRTDDTIEEESIRREDECRLLFIASTSDEAGPMSARLSARKPFASIRP